MRININNSIGCIGKTPVFGRSLTSEELIEYKKILSEAKEKVGNDGMSVLIVHDACLPQSDSQNIGVGNLAAKKSLQFFEFMKNHLGIKCIEILPVGEYSPYQNGRFFCAYSSSAFSLSPHQINLELLNTPEYSSIVTKEDIRSVVKANQMYKREKLVNFENVVNDDSEFDNVLKRAFLRFKDADNVVLKTEFNEYKKANEDWLKPKAMFNVLAKQYGHKDWKYWPSLDKDLMLDIDEIKQQRIDELAAKNKDFFEYYYFKQFLADKHLAHSRKELNTRGLKLIGDCLIGFSKDEVWANQKAFNLDYSIGWGLPALDYEQITQNGSPAEMLLKKKVQMFAKRYDSIRFDVSWAYVQPNITPHDWNKTPLYTKKHDLGSELLNNIENYVREVKGNDFNVNELIHEFDAAPGDFDMLDKENSWGKWRKPLMDRTKALGTTYMSPTWGNNEHFLKLNDGIPNFLLGVGNHDPQPLRQIAYSVPDISGIVHKPAQVEYLSKLFNVKKKVLDNPIEFIKTKFAEIMTAKNNQYFYIDVFGEERRFDSQANNSYENYRLKIPKDFEYRYYRAVERGHAFNPMDALERVFRLRGIDKSDNDLYLQVVKFRDILLEKTVETSKEVGKEIFNQKNNTKGLVAGTICAIAGGIAFFASKKKED